MYLPATPARSGELSNVSSPSQWDNQTASPQLTPRSKVKAMLAVVDEDTDSDSRHNSIPPKPQRQPLWLIDGNDQKHECVEDARGGSDVSEEDSEQDDLPILPRGKMAARLNQGNPGIQESIGSPCNNDDEENAYARVKRQLMQKHSEPTSKVAEENDNNMNAATSTRSTPGSNGRASPGLFLPPPSPPKDPAENTIDSDNDLPENPQANDKFLELVARKRAQRQARQATEEAKKRRRRHDSFDDERQGCGTPSPPESEDEDVDWRLTQHNRPTRKASKKALEEMCRETQRMSRNMQLAHQAKTKKKITKESLLARFSFGGTPYPGKENRRPLGSLTTASSASASDCEIAPQKDTPPTSPLKAEGPEVRDSKQTGNECSLPSEKIMRPIIEERRDALPDMLDVLRKPMPKLDKGKCKAADSSEHHPPPILEKKRKKFDFKQRPIKVHPPNLTPARLRGGEDSESDLEVVPVSRPRTPKSALLDRVSEGKAQGLRPLQTLWALAHLESPPKSKGRKGRPSVSLVELQVSLRKRARQQAVEERRAKIEDLKARGIIVQTAAEKEKEQIEVEDLLEKARREGKELKEKEKRAAKQKKLVNGETSNIDDSEVDEEYENGESEAEIELSGSENEDVAMEDEDGSISSGQISEVEGDEGANGEKANSVLIEDEASEDSQEEEDVGADKEKDEDPGESGAVQRRRTRTIVDEDDEIEGEHGNPLKHVNGLPVSPTPVVEVPKLFEANSDSMPIGMTQIFAGTMADTQTQMKEKDDDGLDSMAFLDHPPEPNLPVLRVKDSMLMVADSQKRFESLDVNHVQGTALPTDIDLQYPPLQSCHEGKENAQTQAAGTQFSEIPDPTQDAGFVVSSPALRRFVSQPPSTIDTVILPGVATDASPMPKKRRHLHRRSNIEEALDKNKQISRPKDDEKLNQMPANAFALMEKARRKAAKRQEFIKKKSEAKEMVEEQAQESDDEYAGLGGASDDESGGEEDIYIREMMDEGEVDVDERELAALHANKQRADDEKAVEKLFKDINTGGLRRKRGADADFDLSDSNDEAEARRRRKQREFAKMRKALLDNENVGKMAEDPKKMAFLKAIEDREEDDDLDFLDRPAEDSFRVQSGTQGEEGLPSQSQEPRQEAEGNRKRALQDSDAEKAKVRPPAAMRRTRASKRPATLAEICESVSFLVEEPGSVNTADPFSSANEEDENTNPPPPDDTNGNPRRSKASSIIDRLTLKRAASTNTSDISHLAFHNASIATTTYLNNSFVPSLLRRATTSSLTATTDQYGISHATTERAAGGGEKGEFVRRGGTKRSSINFATREMQKRGVVEGVERRRREERAIRAKERGNGLLKLCRGSTWEG